MDWNDDGMRRLRRPGRAAGLPRRARRHLPVADALLPDRRPRRRLRHHRLLRRRPAARARTATSSRWSAPRATAACGSSSTWSSTTPPTSTRGSGRPSVERDSPYRDFYVWRADAPPDTSERGRLPRQGGQHLAATTRRPASGTCTASTSSQPDLNITNPRVRDEIAKVMGFWLRARALRLPGGRRAVPARDRRASTRPSASGSPTRTSTCATLRSFVGRRTGDGDPARRGQPAARASRRSSSAASDGDELTMQFDFIGMQNALPLAGPRRTPRPLARGADRRPADARRTVAVGDLRAQPRRAHPRQAQPTPSAQEVFAAFGPDPEHAALRPRPAAPAAADARRRPAADPDGLQPAVLPARHAGALLRRGDRDGREPRRRRAGSPCARRCSGPPGRNGGFSRAPDASAARGRSSRAASAPSTSTSPTSARDPDSLLSFMKLLIRRYRECPELGWGELRGARPAARRRARPRVPLGRRRAWSPSTTSAPSRARCR